MLLLHRTRVQLSASTAGSSASTASYGSSSVASLWSLWAPTCMWTYVQIHTYVHNQIHTYVHNLKSYRFYFFPSPLFFFGSILGIKLRALNTLSKHSTKEPQPQLLYFLSPDQDTCVFSALKDLTLPVCLCVIASASRKRDKYFWIRMSRRECAAPVVALGSSDHCHPGRWEGFLWCPWFCWPVSTIGKQLPGTTSFPSLRAALVSSWLNYFNSVFFLGTFFLLFKLFSFLSHFL